jgi:hypothetical protein
MDQVTDKGIDKVMDEVDEVPDKACQQETRKVQDKD